MQESCNIQQAKKLFNLINYGTVLSMGSVGIMVYLIPWYKWMLPADMMTIGATFILPNIYLLTVRSPSG